MGLARRVHQLKRHEEMRSTLCRAKPAKTSTLQIPQALPFSQKGSAHLVWIAGSTSWALGHCLGGPSNHGTRVSRGWRRTMKKGG